MPSLTTIILVISGILIVYALTCYMFSGVIMYSNRQPITETPADYGMAYEDIQFSSTDGLTIKGWFIPGTSDKLVIMTHPFPFNRQGFDPKRQGFPPMFLTKVNFLKTAQVLNGEGYSLLMFDFRNHGESDSAITGVGLAEYQDVLGVVNYARNDRQFAPENTAFASFCMGANSTMFAFDKAPQTMNALRALAAIQPVSAMVFVRSYLRSVYTPLSQILIPLVNWLIVKRGGFAIETMSPLQAARSIKVPTLYVQARSDRWTELSDIENFYNATASAEKELIFLEGKMNRFDTYNYFGEKPDILVNFLRDAFANEKETA